jgi:hypothetical protein
MARWVLRRGEREGPRPAVRELLAALRAAAGYLERSRHLVRLDPAVAGAARLALARSLELQSAPFALRWS